METATEILKHLRLEDGFYCQSALAGPWGVEVPARGRCGFEFVAEGDAWVTVRDRQVHLQAGDFCILPKGLPYALADTPKTPLMPWALVPFEQVSPRVMRLDVRGKGAKRRLICGGARFTGPAAPTLVAALPEIIVVPRAESGENAWLRLALDAMAVEVSSRRLGAPVVLSRLADVLVLQTVREWLESTQNAGGWIGAVRDPHIGRCLTAMHADPGKAWNLETLSHIAGLSRAVFAERFTDRVGLPPKQYLTHWRMQLGASWLREDGITLAETASRLGYGSEAAFSRAFKRHFGVSPGSHRRLERTGKWEAQPAGADPHARVNAAASSS